MFVCQSDGKQDTIQYEKEEAEEEAGSATIFPRRVRKKKKNLTRKLPKWTSLPPPSPLFGIVDRNERRKFGNVQCA